MGQLPLDWSPEPQPAESRSASGASAPTPWTVSRLGGCITDALAAGVPDPVDVVGEVANWTERNGHWYFSLRDESATISCVMWASDTARATMRPASGDRVVVRGGVTHWSRQGRTQLRVRRIKPDGQGDLQAAYRRLCDQCRAAGWFDDSIKKPLPRVPRRIAILTSPVGAALQDVVRTAGDRWPACRLLLVDIPVQGAASAQEIAQAISRVDAAATEMGIDAMLVTRGGGSIEDLWAFNERAVVEAVHHAVTPIVAAIGHESDTTIIEFVADVRASTPTRAIDVLLPSREDEQARLDLLTADLRRRAAQSMSQRRQRLGSHQAHLKSNSLQLLAGARQQLAGYSEALMARQPHARLARRRQQLEEAAATLRRVISGRMQMAQSRLEQLDVRQVIGTQIERWGATVRQLEGVLAAVGPESVLQRGFSLTTDSAGRVIRDASGIKPGDSLYTHLVHGRVESEVRVVDADASGQ